MVTANRVKFGIIASQYTGKAANWARTVAACRRIRDLALGLTVPALTYDHTAMKGKTHSSRAASVIEPPCAKTVRSMVITGVPRSSADLELPCAMQRFLHIFILKSFALVSHDTSASGPHSSTSSVSMTSYSNLSWWRELREGHVRPRVAQLA